jgi:chorismate synthase
MKYGPDDDSIGAGIFSGRYTSAIVAAGFVAKRFWNIRESRCLLLLKKWLVYAVQIWTTKL